MKVSTLSSEIYDSQARSTPLSYIIPSAAPPMSRIHHASTGKVLL